MDKQWISILSFAALSLAACSGGTDPSGGASQTKSALSGSNDPAGKGGAQGDPNDPAGKGGTGPGGGSTDPGGKGDPNDPLGKGTGGGTDGCYGDPSKGNGGTGGDDCVFGAIDGTDWGVIKEEIVQKCAGRDILDVTAADPAAKVLTVKFVCCTPQPCPPPPPPPEKK